DGLFVEAFERTADRYPTVTLKHRNVDSCALDLVERPQRFDVIAATNAFGDILSDVAAGVTGGIGLSPSACRGVKWAYYEPAHGTAPGKVGQGIANPIAAIRSAALMVDDWGYSDVAADIETAVASTLAS